MTPRHVFRAVSLVVALFGVALLMETGRLALALGAVAGTDTFVASTSAVGFWYQLSFMRLFGVALIGLAILSLWGASQLIAAQQRSLAQTLGGLFAALAAMAVAQQVAIWGTTAGWGIAAVFGTVAAMYGLSTLGRLPGQAA